MEDNVSLIFIEPHESNSLYTDAFQSYKEVYNFSMAKGKGTLEPKFLGGNPIQMDPNNMNSLFSVDKDSKISFNDYFISTKANGLRFMLLIGNKNPTKGTRNIYLVDSKMNFWYIRQMGKKGITDNVTGMLPPIPVDLNVDKCLIDGELLFWGLVKTRIVNKQIREYEISKIGNNKPMIVFLAFDILYGPINPEYVGSDGNEISHLTTFQLGNSGAMVGPKATGRWPTTRRRHVLEQMFLNQDSPLWDYLHIQSPYTLNTIGFSKKGNSISTIEGTRYNFTILVSPFVKMKDLFEKIPSNEIYDTMKLLFIKELENQYFIIDKEDRLSKIKLRFPATPLKFSAEKGKGMSTDGLIFTPTFDSYLVGAWTFCGNKQYKWKPVNELTVDFEIGDAVNLESEEAYFYKGLVKKGKPKVLEYVLDNVNYEAVIKSNIEFTKSSIVECIFSKIIPNSTIMIFEAIHERYDKTEANSYLTALSVLNAGNIRKELDFLKPFYGPRPSVLDLAFFIKGNGGSDSLKMEQKIKVLEAFGKDKLIKCCIMKNQLLIFGNEKQNISEMISKKQKNNNYELELRIDFKNPNYNYANCLINRFIDSEYIPVPIVKIYGETNKKSSIRSVYALLGENEESLILEETIDKIPIDLIKISDNVYNYDFSIVLSEEIKMEGVEIKHGTEDAGNTEYQNRYSITNISKFWRVDIIEYGNAKSLKQAKSMWEQKPKTRVEIEYAPASYSEDLLKWENENILDASLKQLGFSKLSENITRDILLDKLNNYKTFLNNNDPHDILKDLGNVLIKIFTILDMDVGNNYGEESIAKESIAKESIAKESIKVEKTEQPDIEESIFSRMRKFHNFIKAELIGEVAEQFKAPVSLLDISVGKGGDLQKWENADIEIVYGIDPDAESIQEANKRFEEAVKNGRVKNSRKYTFEKKAISNPNTIINKKFDIVSCQFTLHYFFVDTHTLESVVEKISGALKQGGYFIGTTLVDTKVKELIRNNEFKNIVEIKQIDEDSYKMKLLDTAQIYNKDLTEYYVNIEKFKEICNNYDLEFKEAKSFTDMYKIYKKNPKNKKNLLKDYEFAVSSLNTTFIFQKM